MDDNALETLYKGNLPTSHYAGLRGVWDDGYAQGANDTVAQAQGSDPSTNVIDSSALADAPAPIVTD